MDWLWKWREVGAVVVLSAALAGCGGGDGGTAATPAPGGGGTPAPTTPVTPVAITDSFGQPVTPDGGVGDGDAGADGTAGEGAAIVGGRIEIVDSTGKSVTATSDAQGYYRVKVTGFVPPFVAKVTKPDGKVLRSLSVAPLRTNGFVTVNITGLTDKVASDVARAGGKAGAADLTPQIVAANTAAIATSIANLRTTLAPVITAAGLATATFDPIGVPFRPNRQGYDFVLDNTVVTVGPDGQTQVAIAPFFVPTLAGTWRLEVTEGGASEFIQNVAGADVFTPAVLSTPDGLARAVEALFRNDAVRSNSTITRTGNTLRVVGPNTNYTLVIDAVSYSAYVGCGACGNGSAITFTLRTTLTEGGVFNGVTSQQFTSTEIWNFRYVRID